MYYALQKLFETLFERHIWMDVELITETRKAILVRFDDREAWFPKIWIMGVKYSHHCEEHRQGRRDKAIPISIKISESHWAKKFL